MSASAQVTPAFFSPLADYGEVEADLTTIHAWAAANGVPKADGRYRISDIGFARSKAGLPKFRVVASVLDGRAAECGPLAGEAVSRRSVPVRHAAPFAPPQNPRVAPATEAELIDIVTTHQGTLTWTVTPQLAGWLLALNNGNRPMSGRAIDRFISLLRDGAFVNTGEPIIVSREGVLNDGQHRLTAIVRSGVPAEMDLRFGIARQAFAATGTGQRRTVGNVLAISGKPDAAMQAAIGRLLVHHDAGQMNKATQQAEPHQVIAAIDGEPVVAEIAALIRPFKFKPARTAPFGFALVLAARAAPMEQVAEFARQVDSGKAEEDDASRRLHVRLRDAAMNKERFHQIDAAVLVIRAWNAWQEKRPVQLLKVSEADRTAEGFPKARPCKRFTEAEDADLTARRVAGESLGAIAEALGRNKVSILTRLETLALQEEGDG